MKQDPESERLERALRASILVRGGFLGADRRPVAEIVEADAAALARLHRTAQELADRMRRLSQQAEAGQGTTVAAGPGLEVTAGDARGLVPCPWPHAGRYAKTTVRARRTDTGETLCWSALNIHLIEAHGFFEGVGSAFRLDPERLVRVLFPSD